MAKKSFSTFNDIVSDYMSMGYKHQQIELNLYKLSDVEGLVSGYTLLVTINGKLRRLWCCGTINSININVSTVWPHPHQWWMTHKSNYRSRIANILINDGISNWTFKTFEELYDHLTTLGFTPGTLYHYDLARRIGHCLNISPIDYVYLHEGALKGAEIIANQGVITLPTSWNTRVNTSVFAPCFPNVDPIDIENILCIYKKHFNNVVVHNHSSNVIIP